MENLLVLVLEVRRGVDRRKITVGLATGILRRVETLYDYCTT
jgi:hypothetical protein